MRVIGGELKGRILHFPSESKERPTSDFLREALFNLLGPITEMSFLDLFAGSGSVGIEAASRGAGEIYFIEKNKRIAGTARENIIQCGLDRKCCLLIQDAGTGMRELFKKKREFDIIFADPPYNKKLVEETISLLKENPVFTKESLIVIQHSTREDFSSLLDKTNILVDQRKYGDNVLSFLRMEHL